MTFFPSIYLHDNQTDTDFSIAPFGELKVADLVHLIGGSHEGSTIDAIRWSTTLANGGTITISGGVATLRTNITADASALLNSLKIGRFLNGAHNIYVAGIRLGDTGIANNIRRWGVFDDSNGLFFELAGTAIGIVIRKNGSDTRITSFNGITAFVLDTNFHVYEIIYSAGSARFLQDRKLIHKYSNTSSAVCDKMGLKLGAENKNINGATDDIILDVRGSAIYRFGSQNPRPIFRRISTAETAVVLKIGPGTLQRVIINKKGLASATLTLYDGIDATGTIIAIIDTNDTAGGYLEYNGDFNIGLTFTSTSNPGDITILFD